MGRVNFSALIKRSFLFFFKLTCTCKTELSFMLTHAQLKRKLPRVQTKYRTV